MEKANVKIISSSNEMIDTVKHGLQTVFHVEETSPIIFDSAKKEYHQFVKVSEGE
jgi:hypothetical protein